MGFGYITDFIAELKLREKLSPRKNPGIAWFWVFFPALLAYFGILSEQLNKKPLTGFIEVFNSAQMSKIIPQNAKVEVIASGMVWSEGPLWVVGEDGLGYLLFSDTVSNRIFKWEQGKGIFTVGKTLYYKNSGCNSGLSACSTKYEPGSNGLAVLPKKLEGGSGESSLNIVTCQHGNRAVSLLSENGTRIFIATHYQGKRLNSPNDLVWSPEGNLYFTDPTYGLHERIQHGPILGKELNHTGVYMLKKEDVLTSLRTGRPSPNLLLLDTSLELPNGLAFSPDYAQLYVSNSDMNNPIHKVFDVAEDGSLTNGRVFFDSTTELAKLQAESEPSGAPDGMKVDIHGNIFATGPGGLLIISSAGKLLGRVRLPSPASNVAFGNNDGKVYVTCGESILRISGVKTRGAKILS